MDHDPTRELEQSGATGSGPRSGLSEGEYFGRYMVLERVGAGGMGVVYAAYDPTLDRRVALKILARAGTQDMANQRLLREAQAMARLAHPHVATVHEAGEVEGRAFVAMEYLSGGDLHDWLKQRERGWDEIRPVFVAAGQGLAAAHRSGLVHRDFKPSNVMFGGDGRVRVTDFGLARLAEDSQDASFDDLETRFTASDSSAATPLSSPLTREGLIVGTPAYMAPEQILNGRADPRTDQFAFAVSLWEALTGSRPFRASGDFAEMVDHASTYEAPPLPSERRAPSRIYGAVLRALDRDPEQRFASMDDLLAEIGRDPGSRGRRAAAGTALVLAAAMVAAMGWNHWSQRQHLCSGAPEATRSVWNGERRTEMITALESAGALTGPAVADIVDAHLTSWQEVFTEACTASRVRGERSPALLDLQMACLNRRLAETDQFLNLLASPTPELAGAALEAVQQLSGPEQCADVNWMVSQQPLPEDRDVRASVEAIAETLARADAYRVAGDYDRALEGFAAAAEAAKDAGYPPLRAEALVALAFQQIESGIQAPAEDALLGALVAAEQGRHHLAAANAAANLIWLDGFLRQDLDRARHWKDLSAAKLELVDPTGVMRANYLTPWTNVLIQAGRYQEARDVATEALEIQTAADPVGYGAAATYHSFGDVLSAVGAFDEAIDAYERSIELKQSVFGADHPTVASTLASLSQAALEVGDVDRSVEAAEWAIAIVESTWGPEAAQLAVPLNNLATAQSRSGRLDEADANLRRSIAIVEATSGPDDPQLFYSWINVSTLEYQREELQRALDAGQRAATIAVSTWGTEHPLYAYAANNTGVYLMKLDRPAEAVPLLERALQIREAEAVDPLVLEVTRFNLGRALHDAGRRSEGRRLVEQALERVRPIGDRAAEDIDAFEAWLRGH
jgi:tetratricopeptide (TPR) repeat protein